MDSHTALQPRNPSQAVCNGNHRAVSLEGKDPFYIDMLALQIKNILKNIKEERFLAAQVLSAILAVRPLVFGCCMHGSSTLIFPPGEVKKF